MLRAPAPPVGKGLFVRYDLAGLPSSELVRYLRTGGYVWVAISPAAAQEHAEGLRRAGIPWWTFRTPEYWRPPRWREELALHESVVRRLGGRGVLVDAETAPDFDTDEATALLQAMFELRSRGVDVGLTTFYDHPLW